MSLPNTAVRVQSSARAASVAQVVSTVRNKERIVNCASREAQVALVEGEH
jgi:hypothetical protein